MSYVDRKPPADHPWHSIGLNRLTGREAVLEVFQHNPNPTLQQLIQAAGVGADNHHLIDELLAEGAIVLVSRYPNKYELGDSL